MLNTEEETINFINHIEKKFPVDTWTIDGIEIWPLIRGKIADYYIDNNINIKLQKKNNIKRILSFFSRFVREIYAYLKVIFIDGKNSIREQGEFDILISNSNIDRVIELNNKMFDINCDPFYDILKNCYKLKVFVLESFSIKMQNLPRYSKSKYINLVLLKHIILSKLFSIEKNKLKLRGYDKFKSYMKKKYFPVILIDENAIYKQIILYRNLSEELEKNLKKRKIKIVLMMCYYSPINFALSLACKNLRIPCIDIQHGCAGESFHRMYYSWQNIPIQGYKLMPDGFWCWGNDDAKAIMDWGYKGVKPNIFIGGRLIRNIWIDKNNDLYRYYIKKFKNCIKNAKYKKIILVTLQPGVKYENWFKEAIESDSGYLWIIRKHFTIDDVQENFIKCIKKSNNILFTEPKDYPLEFLLNNIDIHVTSYSSVIIDAEFFSKKSIMINKLEVNNYKKYFKLGCLEFADGVSDLLTKIEVCTKNKYVRDDNVNINCHKEIDRLVTLINKKEEE